MKIDETVGSNRTENSSRTLGTRVPQTKTCLLVFLFLLITVWATEGSKPAFAQPTPFYEGKTIRLIVGSTRGTFYDIWANLLARYMPAHIPGEPKIIVQIMPGLRGIVAANYGYNVVQPDGLTLLMVQRHVYLEQLIERKEVQFDLRRFHWIGTPDTSVPMLYIRSDSPYKSIDAVLSAADPPRCGSSTMSHLSYSMIKALELAVGRSMRVVVGYPGSNAVDVAMERGEVICRVTSLEVYFGREPFQTWHKKGFVRPLLLFGRKRDARVPEIPTIYELMEQRNVPAINRQVADLILAGNELGRPIVAPPGTAPEAVNVLRKAYKNVFSDRGFLAEVKKAKIHMEPSSGVEIETVVRQVINQPSNVIARVKTLLADYSQHGLPLY